MTKPRVLSNPRVIAGIFREAIFARIVARIDGEYLSEVIDVAESSRRDKAEKRQLSFALQHARSTPSTICKIELLFSGFIISSTATVIEETVSKLTCEMPTTLENIDLRGDRRISPKFANFPVAHAILIRAGIHLEVTLKLSNISRFGIAGEIEVDRDVSIEPRDIVHGAMHTVEGSINLRGVVVAVEELSARGDSKTLLLRMIRTSNAKIPSPNSDLERDDGRETRRREPRYPIDITMTFRSILAPRQPIALEIIEASISGFFARSTTPFMSEYLLPGVPIQHEGSSMVADVVHSEGDMVRCRWTFANTVDRGQWLKKISPSISKNTALSTPDASQLLEIFCESGAFSSQFLRTQRRRFQSMTDSIESEGAESNYIHRWIDRSSNDNLVGHISCIRMGDNAWFATDLVKSADDGANFSEEFVDKFLHSFSLHALSLTPVPRIFLIWVKGHPYWQAFHRELQNRGYPDVCETAIAYRRTTGESLDMSTSLVKFNPIPAGDYNMITRSHARLQDISTIETIRSFDFDIDRFGSTRLAESVAADKKFFQRRYFETISPEFSGITILTALPDGMNPNRVIDSAWFFEYVDHPITSNDDFLHYVHAVQVLGASIGLPIAGVRRVSSPANMRMLEADQAQMHGYLVHPLLLQKFG
jgi:hypothetical protein